jgi:ribonuclease J
MGIALETPLGTVVHTGDFKIDHTPADGKATDFSSLAQLTANGVLLLLSDSTYAESEGYTESEQVVGEALEHVIVGAEGRVLVATFASLISRMQQVIDAAVKCDRKVAVIGRSMLNNVKMATNMGYLDAPAGTVIPLSEARGLPLNEVVILATGAQGEPTSALVRIANGDHQDVEIVPGDTVIISASPIPGNETLVSRTIDNLYRQGARVLYSKVALVHVHGHASREELKMMLAVVKPRFFVPVHGEYRHLVAHAELARLMGVADEDAIVLEDGDVLELTAEGGTVAGSVPTGHVYVNGRRMWGDDGKVLAERGRLAREGVVTVVVPVDRSTGRVVSTPSLLSSGFVEMDGSSDLLERTAEEVQISLEQQDGRRLELGELKSLVSSSVSKFLYDETRRRPKVLTHIQEV